ncbi:hypothetical protein [Kitasatospora sp. NPDC059571]|uniref:hypothetical protein n=1 Tax=Kitasatospora sp. NPDC059571 TaxID=3346871 RepID=UPI0036A8525C
MTAKQDPHTPAGTAAYLRCYPYDRWQVDFHVRAMEEHAHRLGLQYPQLFLDNGVSSRAVRPQLKALLSQVAMGRFSTVLIPGRWTFSLDDHTSAAVMGFLHEMGTTVVELPRRRSAPRTA